MMRDFGPLLDKMKDATHRVGICGGTQVFIKHKSRNNTYILDEQLHAMQLCIYNGMDVQVEGFEGEHIASISRCTESQNWSRWDQRNNWVWVKQCPVRQCGVLNCRLPWQLRLPFKIKLLNKEGAFIEYWLALALTTMPENPGNLDPVSKFLQARKS
jgi:hypothetical protein